jgi:hypothetical protein
VVPEALTDDDRAAYISEAESYEATATTRAQDDERRSAQLYKVDDLLFKLGTPLVTLLGVLAGIVFLGGWEKTVAIALAAFLTSLATAFGFRGRARHRYTRGKAYEAVVREARAFRLAVTHYSPDQARAGLQELDDALKEADNTPLRVKN